MDQACLILGGANSVWDDLRRAFEFHDFKTVIAVNDVGMEFPEVDQWCTMHPEKMGHWLGVRRDNGYPDPVLWTAPDRLKRSTLAFRHLKNTRGGSGLLAVYVARHLGYKKIVLAGIPMHRDFEHYHTPGAWTECKLYRIMWERDASLLADVRSMSGWTMEHLGSPTEEWLSAL